MNFYLFKRILGLLKRVVKSPSQYRMTWFRVVGVLLGNRDGTIACFAPLFKQIVSSQKVHSERRTITQNESGKIFSSSFQISMTNPGSANLKQLKLLKN